MGGFQVVAEEDAAHHRDPEERVHQQLGFFVCASWQSIFCVVVGT